MKAMTLRTVVAIPDLSIFETVSIDLPWRLEPVRETLVVEDGARFAPTAPVLGVELIEETCGRFQDVPLFDGSINVGLIAAGRSTVGRSEGPGSRPSVDLLEPHGQALGTRVSAA